MKRQVSRLLLTCFLLGMFGSAVRGEREMEFAEGLNKLGFPELAIEQYNLISENEKISELDRVKAHLALVDIYVALANQEKMPERKRTQLDAAYKQLEAFIQKYPQRKETRQARFRAAQISQELGRQVGELIKRAKDKTVAQRERAEAEKYFLNAIKFFDETAKSYKSDVDNIPRIVRDKELKGERAALLEAYLQSLNQSAWTRFYLAEVYALPIINDQAKTKEQLAKAAEQFAAFVDKWRGYLITLAAQCGQGQCYMKLADMTDSPAEKKKYIEKAADAFLRVTRMRRTEPANPIRWLAYMFLAQSYQAAGQYEDAIKTTNRFIMEVPEEFDEEIMRAILIEKAKAYFLLVEQMRKEKKPAKEIDSALKKGLDAINKVISWGGYWAQQATDVKAAWSKKLQLKGTETLPDVIALAKRSMDEKKYDEAIGWYQDAVRRAELGVDDKVVGDAWYRMGECYFNLQHLYEGGLAFQELASRLPDDPKAEHAAYLATLFMGQVYQRDPSDYTANLYRDALVFLATHYPDHEKSPEAVFRVGEVLRAEKEFEKAGDLYGTIPQYSEFYEKASYLSGNAYWSAFLELVATDPETARGEKGIDLWRKAVSKLEGFLAWAKQQPEISPEHTAEKRFWMAKAKVRLACIYTDILIRQDQKGLDVLANFEQEYGAELLARRKKEEEQLSKLNARKAELEKQIDAMKKQKQDAAIYENELEVTDGSIEMTQGELNDIGMLIPSVIICRVDGYIGTGNLEMAEKFIAVLRSAMKNYDLPTQSRLCRGLGGAYVRLAETLRESKGPPEQLKMAETKAAKYLFDALDIHPEQSFAEYVWIGTKLYELRDLPKAIAVFEPALQKYKSLDGTKEYWDAKERLAVCYFEAEQWDKSRGLYDELLAKRDPKNMEYKRRLAESLEYGGSYDRALKLWTETKDELIQGTPLWFEATYHAVCCNVELKKFDEAYDEVAKFLIIYPEMGGKELREKFLKLIFSKFPEDKKEKFDKLMKQVSDDEGIQKEMEKIRMERIKELKPGYKE